MERAFLDVKGCNERPREEFEVGTDGRPAIRTFDENGNLEHDLLKSTSKRITLREECSFIESARHSACEVSS